MANVEAPAIVIDNGSCTSKVGYAGDDAPYVIFPSIVGHPKRYDPRVGKSWLHCFIGDDAKVNLTDLDVIHPIENGIVTNWDDMYQVIELYRTTLYSRGLLDWLLLTGDFIPYCHRFGIIF